MQPTVGKGKKAKRFGEMETGGRTSYQELALDAKGGLIRGVSSRSV